MSIEGFEGSPLWNADGKPPAGLACGSFGLSHGSVIRTILQTATLLRHVAWGWKITGELLNSDYGDEIDAHDAVIRVNYPPIEGFTSHVGSKTTFDFTNHHNAQELVNPASERFIPLDQVRGGVCVYSPQCAYYAPRHTWNPRAFLASKDALEEVVGETFDHVSRSSHGIYVLSLSLKTYKYAQNHVTAPSHSTHPSTPSPHAGLCSRAEAAPCLTRT